MFRYLIYLALLAIVAGLIFVRFVPFDTERFHRPAFPAKAGDYEGRNSFQSVRALNVASRDVVKALDEIILATPRTRRVAGAPGTELITYETRSLIFGFPDFTNVSVIEPGAVGNELALINVRGQARFGIEDLGQNKKRIENWIEALGPLTVSP